MRFLRTNTATRISIGPFLDKTDGITPETALTVTNCKLTMTVDDGGVPTLVLDTNPTASGGNNDMAHITGDDAGMYDLELTAANVNFLGRAKVIITDAANHCPVWEDFMILPAMIYDSLILGTDRLDTNVTHIADTSQTARDIGASVLLAADQAVNATKIGGTTQTGRDIGASVLLSSGTGAGQLDFTSGVVKANLAQILGTALTETAGQIAAAFKKFFDKASPTGTVNSLPDAVAGAASGLALVGSNVGTATSVSGSVGSVTTGVTVTTNNDKTGYGLSSAAVQAIWDALTSALTTAGSIGKWIVDKLDVVVSTRLASASYAAPLDAAGTRSAIGLASANLDTQLSAIDDFLDTEVAAIKAKTDNLPTDPADASDIAGAFSMVNSALTIIDTEVGNIKAKTDNLPDDPADQSSIAISFTSVNDTLASISTSIDTTIADSLTAIQSKTNNLPTDPAATSDIPSASVIAEAVWEEPAAAHATPSTTGAVLLDKQISGYHAQVGVKPVDFTFEGGRIASSMQGETVITIQLLTIAYDGQYEGMLFVISDFDTGMRFNAIIKSSDQSANTFTLSRPVTDVSAVDPLYFMILPSDVGDIPTAGANADAVWDEDIVAAHTTPDTAGNKLSKALILYEGD